jgi:hypothetical protein
VDPEIVVQDGYNRYAVLIGEQLLDPSYEIDTQYRSTTNPILVKDWSHKLRIGYSLIVAIINLLTSWDVIIIGRIVSVISFIASIYLLNLILLQSDFFGDKWKRDAIIVLYVTNVTIITNIVRFETDIFFLALVMTAIVMYQQSFRKSGIRKLASISLLCLLLFFMVFTREIGVILIGVFVIHRVIVGGKIMKLGFIIAIVSLIVSFFLLEEVRNLLFFMLWSAGTHYMATEVFYNGNILFLFEYMSIKFTTPYLLSKNLESLAYAFGVIIPFASLGLFHVFKDSSIRKKVVKNPLTIFFIFFIIFFYVIKVGRTLDRFFMPIIFIPYLLVPAGVQLLSEIFREKNLTTIPEHTLRGWILSLIPISQIMIYGVRLILALLEIGVTV